MRNSLIFNKYKKSLKKVAKNLVLCEKLAYI